MSATRITSSPGQVGNPSRSDEDRVTVQFVLGLFLLSLACRLVLIHFKDVVGTDETIYLLLGRNLWHGLGFQLLDRPVTLSPPLLPIVAGFFSLFTDDLEVGTNFTYVVFGASLVVPYFFLARRVYGSRVARRAAFLITFFPGLLLSFYWGSMTEPLYTFLLVTSMLFVHKGWKENSLLSFSLAGFFLALTYLARSEGILFFPVLFVFCVLFFLKRKVLFQKRTLVRVLAMLVLFAVTAAPYPLFLKNVSGELSISGKTKLILMVGAMKIADRERLAGKLDASGREFVDYEERVKDKTVLGIIRDNPMVLLGGSLYQIKEFFVNLFSWKVFPAFLLPFIILGLFQEEWDRERLENEAFLFAASLPFLVFLTFRIWPRYLLPLTPILLLWTARGVVSLEDWIRETWKAIKAPAGAAPAWALALPLLLVSLPLVVILVAKPIKARMLVQYPVEYREAGMWIDAHLPRNALILARKPEVAYYARRLMHPLPNEELPRVLRYARAHGIEYLVVDEYMIGTRPQLAFLLEDGPFPDDIILLHEVRAPNGRKLRIFQIREPLKETREP